MPIITFKTTDKIFYACPRTGTTSLRLLLKQQDIINIWSLDSIPKTLLCRPSFTFVRNPFDRFISSWQYSRKYQLCNHEDPREFFDWTLNNELPYAGPNWSELQLNGQIRAKRHTVPMTSECFALRQAQTVFRFEDYKNSCRGLCDETGIEYADIHVNDTKHPTYHYYYNKYNGLYDMVLEYFMEDFITFHYKV